MADVKVEPLIFKTLNDNYYFYDNMTRLIFPLSSEERNVLERIKVGDNIEQLVSNNKNSDFFQNSVLKYNLFEGVPETKLYSEENIKSMVLHEGIPMLCLVVTESCNFRCNYCIFSDHYYNTRQHNKNDMNFDTARKAVDYFVEMLITSIEYNPRIEPFIGFYGGEPLIKWDLIKDVVTYIKQYYPKISEKLKYTITTNGFLLEQEKIDFMLNNNFFISVSFDGPRNEHDRNRKTVDGNPTFNTVREKINLIEERSKYAKKLVAPIPYNLLITFDNFTDLIQLESFFANNTLLDQRIGRITKVNELNTTYYNEQNSRELYEKRMESLKLLYEHYKEGLKAGKVSRFLQLFYKNLTLNAINNTPFFSNSMRGSCIPGLQKLTVDPSGNYHMCEKVNYDFPIGNITNGLNHKLQSKYINDLLSALNKKCDNCNVSNLCNVCYAAVELTSEGISFSEKFCNTRKKAIKDELALYYSILEEEPSTF